MVNATAVVKALFTTPQENMYILMRIEFLVVISSVLFIAMSILDIFRGYFHSAPVKGFLTIFYNVSDSIVLYVMGCMQSVPFKNQLFPVWAIVLVGFRNSTDFISAYGILDKNGRRFIELNNVVKLLGSAFLNKTRGSMFAYPLWSLWVLQMVKSAYRFRTRQLALNSVWHGRSSELLLGYLRPDTHHDNFKLKNCEAKTMEGYKYLVYGETWRRVTLKKPRYVLQIDTNPTGTQAQIDTNPIEIQAKAPAKKNSKRPANSRGKPLPESLITLDKIWQCNGALLHPNSTQGDNFKDLSLAFSLSRVLRCRLEDVTLHKESIVITKNLVLLRIINEDPNRAFRVLEMEMAFLNDYFNTRYPMVFWGGLRSLCYSFTMSAATIGIVCWLSVDIRRVYETPKNEFSNHIHGVNVDIIITWILMFFMMFKEIWEMVLCFLSDWTRLLLACTYVRWTCACMRNDYVEKFISSFFTSKVVARRWHGVIDQYVFLESYADNSYISNCMYIVSTGVLPKREKGATLRRHINIPECVRPAILEALRSLNLTHAYLPDVIQSLSDEPGKKYRWACSKQPSSHIILVWHIATSLCEIRFASKRGINLSNRGFAVNALLYVSSFFSPHQAYLVSEKTIPDGNLKNWYIIANSLSRYCAYLLVSKPGLLPDSFLVPKMVFEETVNIARGIMKDSDSLEKILIHEAEGARNSDMPTQDVSKTEKPKTVAQETDKDGHRTPKHTGTPGQDTSASKQNINVVEQGAKLAKQLMEETEESCWEILSGVWTDLLVHIAPSWNSSAHKKCLESGGEFITHIWALLCHCGTQKSKLWRVEDPPRNSAPGATANINAENNSVEHAQDMRGESACSGETDDKQGMLTAAMTNGEHNPNRAWRNGSSIRGMQNLGSTCYFNAVLQSLLAFRELRIKILEQDSLPGSIHSELKRLFQETSGANGAGDVLVTEMLFSLMSSENGDFEVGKMEDSSNLFRSLLNCLMNEESVKLLFRGEVVKRVTRQECAHVSDSTEVLDLILAIPSKEDVSVEDCLDEYITGYVNGWHCTACAAAASNGSSNKKDTAVVQVQTEESDSVTHQKEQSSNLAGNKIETLNRAKVKQPILDGDVNRMEQRRGKHEEEKELYRAAKVEFRITKAPPLLTIQLKRYGYVNPDRSDKLKKHVSFQEKLDITKFMDPKISPAEDVSYKYSLVSVIVHEGPGLSEGHIVSYVRESSTEQENSATHSWFCASDEKVTKVSLQDVLNCQAYILFYERINSSR